MIIPNLGIVKVRHTLLAQRHDCPTPRCTKEGLVSVRRSRDSATPGTSSVPRMKPEDLPPHSSHEGQSGVKIGVEDVGVQHLRERGSRDDGHDMNRVSHTHFTRTTIACAPGTDMALFEENGSCGERSFSPHGDTSRPGSERLRAGIAKTECEVSLRGRRGR